jgi:putative FmdB family regulatory protein
MPLYEYQCEACGHRFETIQKFSDSPLETCPKCGGHVQKLQSAPAFQFKGTGWYITDYAKKDQGGAKAGSPGSSEKANQSDGGSASKDAGSGVSAEKSDTAAKSSDTKASNTPSAKP